MLFESRSVLLRSRLAILATPLLLGLLQAQTSIPGARGSEAALLPSGQFAVVLADPAWSFSGKVGAKVQNALAETGSDPAGAYRQITFQFSIGGSLRTGHIRAYQERPLFLFGLTYSNASDNTSPFPVFSSYPAGMLHMSFNGQFSLPNFPSLTNDSPWVYYDTSGNTFIVSPAANYLTASTTLGPKGEISAGISNKIGALPAGFTHWTALAFDRGINRAFDSWGNSLTALRGKNRPASDSEPLLKQISYWTDNGANYYYNTAPSMGYPETFRAIQSDFQKAGIALGSIQLDSWWYPKGPVGGWHGSGGIWSYTAAPDLFPPSLPGMQRELGLPLIAHARWIDAQSPLRQQFAVSGNVATDPQFWEETARYFQEAGIRTFEQDWLGDNAHPNFNLTDPYAFFDNMAASMGKRGITMQYCMAEPRHFLQGTYYDNLTTVRSSQDRFGPTRWTEFLYSSRFASALGEFPFTDVFMSGEYRNLLFATLSAGPVGIGDKVRTLSGATLLRAVRTDGVIVKPDAPATPIDNVFISDAQNQNAALPMVASAYSDFGALRAVYIVAYQRDLDSAITVEPALHGIAGDAYLYDYFQNTSKRIAAGSRLQVSMTDGFGYWILAPVGPSGIALAGDMENYVTMGKKRVSSVSDDGMVTVRVEFGAGEATHTLFGYSPVPVHVAELQGRADSPTYDAAAEKFTVRVHRSGDGLAGEGFGQFRIRPSVTGQTGKCVRPCGGFTRRKGGL